MIKRSHYTNELEKAVGKSVVVAGWTHDVRVLGNINFILLRDSGGIAQITAAKDKVPKDVLEICKKLHQEDVIVVEGKVVENKKAPRGIEIIPSKIDLLNKAQTPLPLDPTEKVPANLDTRLDWRSIDLRKPKNLATFKIQAKIIEGFETYLRKNGFVQVYTPSIIGGTSESGSEVFPVVYYNKEAFLRQDPQLHRELLIAGGFEKIFDAGPSWRAEKSHTVRHLSEHRTIAPELAFIKDEHDVIEVEQEMVVFGLKFVQAECAAELELLKKEVAIPKKIPILEFPKIYDILEGLGKKTQFGEEYDKESEMLLGEHVKEKFKCDFFFVNRFPFAAKPFYVMRIDEEPQWARSVDLIFKGVEMSSGGQREHRYEKIIAQMKEKKMKVDSLKWFTEVFRYGVPPMGGYSIGIERFTQQLLDIPNVRETTLFPRDPERLLP